MSADRSWKRGRTGRRATFSRVSVPGQKRCRILPLEKPVLWAFQSVTQPWPQSILFGHEGPIILRGGPCQPRQCLAVIPRHPPRWVPLQLFGVPLQLGEIVERSRCPFSDRRTRWRPGCASAALLESRRLPQHTTESGRVWCGAPLPLNAHLTPRPF